MTTRRRAVCSVSIAAATGVLLLAAPVTAAPAPSAHKAPAPAAPARPVSGLIVTYAPGAAAAPGEGVIGQRSTGAALRTGRPLPGGQVVVPLAAPLDTAAASRVARELAADPRVERVEPDLVVTRQSATAPNDPLVSRQWPLVGPDGVRPAAAWQRTHGAGVVVAVIDTGITAHPDLAGQVVPGYDMISDPAVARDGDGRDADASDRGDAYAGDPSSWHGTHVTGTVVAVADNGTGVAGLASRARVQPVRVLGAGGGELSDVISAIYWASGAPVPGVPANPTPARVINMSLGGAGACGPSLQAAIDTAVNRGVTVVVAAGNDGAPASGYVPGNCAHVVTVAATGPEGYTTSYSNYGTGVDLAAPGGDFSYGELGGVLSTLNTGSTDPAAPGYAYYQGTSMATPHVAAAAALLLSDNPALTPAQVEARLTATARVTPRCAPVDCGAGVLDAGVLLPAPSVLGQKHLALGGTTTLGDPVGAEYAVTGGSARAYDRGRVYRAGSSPTAYGVVGAILTDYLSLNGANGPLGLPTSDEVAVTGGRASRFVVGDIYWSSGTGAHAVYGLILAKYRELGASGSVLGLPTADESAVPGGRKSVFARGNVYWSSGTGAHPVYGAILATYLAAGGAGGKLGLPTTDEYAVPGGRRSDFRGGSIRFDAATGKTTTTFV